MLFRNKLWKTFFIRYVIYFPKSICGKYFLKYKIYVSENIFKKL